MKLKRSIENNELHIPDNFVFIGDEAFPLKSYLMRPYPRRELNKNCKIYNYRLSRARRTVENAFGLLVSRFRVFEKPIATCVETAVKIVKAACVLHNWLLTRSDTEYFSSAIIDKEDVGKYTFPPGSWRELESRGLSRLQSFPPRFPERNARELREYYVDFFNGPGAVTWQDEAIC